MTAGSFEHQQALSSLQGEAFVALTALAAAGDRPPNGAYERFLTPSRKLLEQAAAYVAVVPGGLDVPGIARPIVQQLGMYADHRQADGDRAAADALRHEADTITKTYLDETATAEVRRDRAMLAATDGRFNEALSELEAARSVFATDGNVLEQVQTELKIANVYEWLGDYERALRVLETAHAAVAPFLEQGPPSQSTVMSLLMEQFKAISSGAASSAGTDAMRVRSIAYEVIQAQARDHRSLGDYDLAEQLFQQARPFVVELGLPAGIDFHLAVIAVARDDLDRAEHLLASVAPTFEQPMTRWRRGSLRQVQADFLLRRGRAADALAAADDGLADQSTYPDLDLAWKLQWRRARALTAQGSGDALAAFRAAMMAADRLRMAPLGYRLDTTFLRDKLPMAHQAIDAALAAADPEAIVWFVELIKSRALATALSVPRTITVGADAEASFDAISREIDALAFASYSGAADRRSLQQREALLARRDRMLESIRIRDPRWRAMTEPAPVDLDAIRARLGPGRAALVLFHRPGSVVSAVIETAGITAGSVELNPATTAALTAYAEGLRQQDPDEFLADISQESGVTLADLLAPEVLAAATAAEMLIVVPHGMLHLLPWSCMAVAPLAPGQARLPRLFEHAAVGVLPNLASLLLLDADTAAPGQVALIGNADYTGLGSYPALTESSAEIADIASIYGQDGLIRSPREGADATEAAFWELATAAQSQGSVVLHVSGHGSLDASEPLASGLVLTRSTVDAAEILLRRLPYDEVVLSACSTAWRPMAVGDIELAGDDALGLPASFLEAGARFLLAGIPPVREKVARTFTVGWHRHRHAGLSPLAAFRAVQLDLLARDPAMVFSWAGLTSYGCR